MHCVLLYLHKELGIDLGMIVEGTKDVSAVSTKFLIFFLVYYGGNCYKRYYDMYNACMSMAGDVQCWVGLARVRWRWPWWRRLARISRIFSSTFFHLPCRHKRQLTIFQ